jgi:quercetin dioxygenase-like cupin family protein
MRVMTAVLITFAAFGTAAHVLPQTSDPKEHVLVRKDLSAYAGKDMVLTVRALELAPGAVGQKHRHPGPVVVYVLSGSVEVHLDGQPPKIFHAGESFSEDAHQLHVSTRNISTTEPVRLLSYILSKKGEALTQPEK